MKKHICGIYKITNPIGQVYIGKSTNIKARFSYHKNINHHTKLGYSIRIYGHDNHIFEIIEECDKEIIFDRERFWQEHFEVMIPRKGLNGNYVLSSNKNGSMFSEHRYWRNFKAIGYNYSEYGLSHENISYTVSGVIEIMPDYKQFFLNDVLINGTSIRSWINKNKILELNKTITNKINKV